MKYIVYVKLMNEGSVAWRPVQAICLPGGLYQIAEDNIYDQENKTSIVVVEEQVRSGEAVPVVVTSGA
ncbi:hypothetical protein [Hymenobacter jeollabukensis]|uniref:Uncharacterized protein n=1 Tax=Hymenobacter jeollabukensis TaxID=2025313 RepID=A0A5R8WLT0_9BACT|nr:hypothetical protein [Hymenobacter jeollabukensis]TLM90140.1 hypothetical protein FDY95_19200 [Hymenobacter jeollabukensis]